jgi:hypothetical protein
MTARISTTAHRLGVFLGLAYALLIARAGLTENYFERYTPDYKPRALTFEMCGEIAVYAAGVYVLARAIGWIINGWVGTR